MRLREVCKRPYLLYIRAAGWNRGFTIVEFSAKMPNLSGTTWQIRHMLMQNKIARVSANSLSWIGGKLLRRFRMLTASLAVLLAALPVLAAHTKSSILLAVDSVKPGDTVLAGIRLRMDPGWHTYWTNSGASGAPIIVEWNLPAGITADPIQWPVPEKMPEADFTTYVYSGEVILVVPLHIKADSPAGPQVIKAHLQWLECATLCVKGETEVEANLIVGTETKAGPGAAELAEAQKGLPQKSDALGVRATWENLKPGNVRSFILEWNPSAAGAGEFDFFPQASEKFEVLAPTELLPVEKGAARLRKQVKLIEGSWPTRLSGVLGRSGAERVGYQIDVAVSGPAADGSASTTVPLPPTVVSETLATPLIVILFYAFIGGLILNVMPCVLPVIALKILGFVAEARNDPKRVRNLGLIYAMGVLVSFLALAALVLGVRFAGHKAGWGMQFGNPQFLVVLTVLVTLVALSLFGLFEVNLGSRTMGAAGSLASKHGAAGAFFNGVLATVLATPCTAPFLSIALGFAFAQGAVSIVTIFLTIGLGLAAPYVLLSWNPAWLSFVPKPGAWMERFKIAMGFPMLATAVWLFSLLPIHYGERSWWVGIFLVIVALAAWVYGEFIQRGRTGQMAAGIVIGLLLLVGYLGVLERRLHWREVDSGPVAIVNEPKGITWQKWSAQAVDEARAQGRPVLVDFTAKWCVTCNAIVKPALEADAVRKKVEQTGAVTLLADYTRFPPEITQELNRYGRAGVPLVLAYPKNAQEPAIVLPEPSPLRGPGHYSEIVLGALEQASR